MTNPKKTKKPQPQSVSDEITIGQSAYAGYLSGRLAGAVPPESSVRTELVRRYSGPRLTLVEKFTFLLGIRESNCPLLDPEELLTAAHVSLRMGDVLGVPS